MGIVSHLDYPPVERNTMVLDRLDEVEVIANDILVYRVRETEEEVRQDLYERILYLITWTRKKVVKINKQKIKLHLPEIIYI